MALDLDWDSFFKPDENEYGVYSEFDIDKHAATFINYLEVIIHPDGKVEYAVPSHQQKLERILKAKVGVEEFNRLIEEPEAYYDYLVFLCTQTGCCSVWNNFYTCGKQGLTNEQKEALRQLQMKKDRFGDPLFKGNI